MSRRAAALTALAMLLAPVAAPALPAIQTWTLANGARVYFVPARDLPMVDVRVVFDAGSARDGAHAGLARLTNTLLADGAGDLDADQVATRFDALGVRFGSGALRDMAWVSLRSLSEKETLDAAAALVARVLTAPRLAPADFRRERARMRVARKAAEQSLGEVAERAFYRALYGSHPYAHPPGGTARSLAAITRAEVLRFHRRYYAGRNAVVAIVGDLDRDGARALARRVAGALPAGAPAPPLPAVPAPAARTVEIRRTSTQTHVRIGTVGMRRGDPDYFALYVGNHVLGGGGLVSRLSQEIRERRGLSYSVYSYFVPMHRRGPFVMGLQTRNGQAREAVSLLRAGLRRFVADGPTEAELAAAKENIIGGFPLRIDSNADIVEYLAMIGFYRLPLDYLQTFPQRVRAVTRAAVRDAFRRRVDPQRLVTVVVGGGAGEGRSR